MQSHTLPPRRTDLGGMINRNWNRNSNFLLGINYLGSSGDLWTSLALKLEVKKMTGATQAAAKTKASLGVDFFKVVPQWVASFLLESKTEGKDRWTKRGEKKAVILCMVDKEIDYKVFTRAFSAAALKNYGVFFYRREHQPLIAPILEESKPIGHIGDAAFYLCEEETFYKKLEEQARENSNCQA